MTQLSDEVGELATAYFALKRIPPEGRDSAMRYLSKRVQQESADEKRAALAVARFARALKDEAKGEESV